MAINEIPTVIHLGRGLIGLLFFGVIVGVYFAVIIAKKETSISKKTDNKTDSV